MSEETKELTWQDTVKEAAQRRIECIREMMDALDAAQNAKDGAALEEAEEAIEGEALSVEVREDWHSVGVGSDDLDIGQYRLLLCSGGPASQIIGDLNLHKEPENARFEHQDWHEPWTEAYLSAEDKALLLRFASRFYFGG